MPKQISIDDLNNMIESTEIDDKLIAKEDRYYKSSIAQQGRVIPDAVKKHLRQINTGKKHSEQTIARIKSKPPHKPLNENGRLSISEKNSKWMYNTPKGLMSRREFFDAYKDFATGHNLLYYAKTNQFGFSRVLKDETNN